MPKTKNQRNILDTYFISIHRLGLTIIFSFIQILANAQNTSQQSRLTSIKNQKPDSLSIYDLHLSDYEAYGTKETNNPDETGHTNNKPQITGNKFIKNGFYLVLDTQQISINKDSNFCHKLYVINKSDSSMTFSTCGGNLNLTAEALDVDGKWKPIEYHVYSSCGNSYYNITLDTNEFWSFPVPIYKGKYKTKLRFVLSTERLQEDYFSNEIATWLNEEQFDRKEVDNVTEKSPIILSNRGSKATVASIGFNVVFIGIKNILSISVPGYSEKDIQASTSVGRLEWLPNSSEYILQIDSTPKDEFNRQIRELQISVSVKEKYGKLLEKANYKFRIREIPMPVPGLGSIHESGTYSKGVIRSATFVYCLLQDFPFEGIIFTPIEYTIQFTPKIGPELNFQGTSQELTKEIKRAFNAAVSGDRFMLIKIKARGPNGLVEVPHSLTITVE